MRAVRAFVHEIRRTLRCFAGDSDHAGQVLSILDQMDLSEANQHDWMPSEPPHDRDLWQAIEGTSQRLDRLAKALREALPELQWRVDRGTYYELTADVGDGYRNGNMHCELIGPHGSAFHHPDFTLGLFLLTPHVLYRDHAHRAPELYLTLSGPSGWRFNGGAWQDVPPGTIIWNAPEKSHATRVYDDPFLAIYSWTRDIRSKCRVVPCADWAEIEAALQSAESGARPTPRKQPHVNPQSEF